MAKPRSDLTRRHFLQNSAALAVGAAVAHTLPPLEGAVVPGNEFLANWRDCPDRVWLGPDFWSNPLQDWRVAGGRAECTNAAADRNVHVLTRSLSERDAAFTLVAELMLLQHTCQWYCRSRLIASARLQALHQTAYAQVVAGVSAATRADYRVLVSG